MADTEKCEHAFAGVLLGTVGKPSVEVGKACMKCGLTMTICEECDGLFLSTEVTDCRECGAKVCIEECYQFSGKHGACVQAEQSRSEYRAELAEEENDASET